MLSRCGSRSHQQRQRMGSSCATSSATRRAPSRPARSQSATFFERQPESRQGTRHGGRTDRDAVVGVPVDTVLGQRGIGMRGHLGPQCRFACRPMWRRRPRRRLGATAPVARRCCCQRRMVRSVTPKVRVASARASPASRARSKRSRKSAEYCFIAPASHPDNSYAPRSSASKHPGAGRAALGHPDCRVRSYYVVPWQLSRLGTAHIGRPLERDPAEAADARGRVRARRRRGTVSAHEASSIVQP